MSANVSEFEKNLASMEKSLGSVGSKLQSQGARLTSALTLPIMAIGAASVKAAMDFESSFAGVKKTVDATDKEFAQMAQGFRDMAKRIPVSVNELNKIGEAAGQLGIPKDKILEFSEVMAKLGATTNLTSDQAATATAQIQNIFGASGKETSNFASSLVALGNAGASTESQIIDFGLRIAGAGHQVNMSQAEILGWSNAMASLGLNAEAGGTAFSKVLSKISVAVDTNSDKLKGFAEVAGLQTGAFAQLFKADASEAMNKFVDGLHRIKESGGNLTVTLMDLVGKDVRVLDAFKRMAGAGDMVRTSLDLGKKSWQENSALNQEFGKRAETTAAKLQVLWNRVYDVGISLGQVLIPALMRLMPAVEAVLGGVVRLVDWFSHLPQSVQMAAIGFAGFLAAIGPLAFVIGQVVSAGGAIAGLFRMMMPTAMTTAFFTAKVAVSDFAVAALAIPGVGVAGAILAIGAAAAVIVPKLRDAVHEFGAMAVAQDMFFQGLLSHPLTAGLFGGGGSAPRPGRGGTHKDVNLPDEVGAMAAAMQHQQDVSAELAKRFPGLVPGIGGGGGGTAKHVKTDAERAAEKWADELDKLSGREAIKTAATFMQQVEQIGGVTALAAKDQERYNVALGEALDAMARLNKVADMRTVNAWFDSFAPPKLQTVTEMFSRGMPGKQFAAPMAPIPNMGFQNGIQGGVLPGQQFGIPQPPPPTGFLTTAFGSSGQAGFGIASAIMGAIQSGGSTWEAGGAFIGQGIATQLGKTLTSGAGLAIGGALGGAINAILPGIGALLGPLLGKLGGFFKNLFGGNDVKALINEQFGSYDALHAKLMKLGAAGEQMWIKLTQHTGRNDLPGARDQIDAINTALGQSPLSMEDKASQAGFSTKAELEQNAQESMRLYEFMRDSGKYSAAVVEDAWKRANDAMIASGDSTAIAAQHAKDSVAGLTQQIDALTQSIANEAPEEVMGVIEAQTRAKIDALEHERSVAQTFIDELNAQRIIIPVRLDTSGIAIDWPAVMRGEMPEGWTPPMSGGEGFEQPEVPAMATGGVVRASRGGTIVRLAEGGSDEAVVPLKSGGFSGGGAGSTIVIEMDGRSVAEFIVPHIPGVVRRYGLV